MSDEQIRQRIAYLVEHGGLYDDPIADLRNRVRVLSYLVGTALFLNFAQLASRLL